MRLANSKFEKQIEESKKSILKYRRKQYVKERTLYYYRRRKSPSMAEYLAEKDADKQDFSAKRGFLEVEWDSGYIVVDIDDFFKLPKSKRNKILSLGGEIRWQDLK